MHVKQTIEFQVAFGVMPGYGGEASRYRYAGLAENMIKHGFAEIWREEADLAFNKYQIYVPALYKPGKIVYSMDWGCPVNGELVIEVSGVANPEFVESEQLLAWRKAVIQIVEQVRIRLMQTTVSLVFRQVEFMYLKD